MSCRTSTRETGWLKESLDLIEQNGYVVIEDAVDLDFCRMTAQKMIEIRPLVASEFQNFGRKNDEGFFPLIPLMMKYDPFFYKVLELEPLNEMLEGYISPQVIVRNFSGQPVDPVEQQPEDRPMQHNYHRNFRHIEFAPKLTMEVGLPLSTLTPDNGAFYIIPGSHKLDAIPSYEYLEEREELVPQPLGSLLFVDGMTWHREDTNRTSETTYLVIMQFSKPIIKQFFDYPRALAGPVFEAQSARTQKLLGKNAIVPANLEEFCRREG